MAFIAVYSGAQFWCPRRAIHSFARAERPECIAAKTRRFGTARLARGPVSRECDQGQLETRAAFSSLVFFICFSHAGGAAVASAGGGGSSVRSASRRPCPSSAARLVLQRPWAAAEHAEGALRETRPPAVSTLPGSTGSSRRLFVLLPKRWFSLTRMRWNWFLFVFVHVAWLLHMLRGAELDAHASMHTRLRVSSCAHVFMCACAFLWLLCAVVWLVLLYRTAAERLFTVPPAATAIAGGYRWCLSPGQAFGKM